MHHPNPKQDGRWRLTMPILRLVVLEVQHRLHQLDELGLLSPSIRRFLLDENVPGASVTIVPELTASDFFKLLENPTKEAIDYWILKGERSVWPAVTALKIRCAIEIEIDRGYQLVRRRRPMDERSNFSSADSALKKVGSHDNVARKERGYGADTKREQHADRRKRAKSFGDGSVG
jgi:TAG lipase/lysophosphatidylethanolamine acyltransferase